MVPTAMPGAPAAQDRDRVEELDPVRVAVIIPALDEERSLPLVLAALSRFRETCVGRTRGGRRVHLRQVVVVDNGSTDGTAEAAARCGATVLSEPRRGYGRACLRGLAHLAGRPPDIVAFLDADFSDDPSLLPELVLPVAEDDCDLVLGSRRLGDCEPGALLPQARYGNALSVALIRALYGFRYTDLGPFRAVSYRALAALRMRDATFGWTAEMQVKSLLAGLRVRDVPVPYRRRVGSSKITGTVWGTVRAGAKILWTIVRLRLATPRGLSRVRGRS